MRIGGLGSVYPTYVYNPGVVSSKSMNKLSRISDDVLDKKVDYSGVEAKENQNPLKKGQTIDFEGMLAKQMQQGRSRAAKVMPEGLSPVENREEKKAVEAKKENAASNKETENTAVIAASNTNEAGAASENNSSFNFSQMQKAIQAYEMFMIA